MKLIMQSVKFFLRPFRRKIFSLLPSRLTIKPAIAQAYIGGVYESRFTLTNFPSLYSPLNATKCVYLLKMYDANGFCIAQEKISIDEFGSFEVRPNEVFGFPLPQLGMFTARIMPVNLNSYRHLGKIASHFYALYSDKGRNSFVLVHPQTYVNELRSERQEWISGISLDAHKIRKISAIQINPTNKTIQTNLFLVTEQCCICDNYDRAGVIPPMGSRLVEWDLEELGIHNGYISVGGIGLPTNNAKPILLTHFKDGSFTGMHG
jgi:hypothetical protein